MNIPGYDAWKLSGPDERPEPVMVECEHCRGDGWLMDSEGGYDCPECDGTGEVEEPAEEPDGDYEFESRRDAILDRE